jgi:putative phage-type endonuclease
MDTDAIIDVLLNRMPLERVIASVERRSKERENEARTVAALPDGIPQRTEEWYAVRRGMITASEFKTACADSNRGYVMGKVFAKPFVANDAMLWGCRMEDLARMVYEFENDASVREYGLIVHSRFDWMGASPDGITPYGVMLEFKAPYSRKACQIAQRVSDERWFGARDRANLIERYMPQVQGQMEVCDLNACDFVVAHIDEIESPALFWQRRLVTDQRHRYAVVVCVAGEDGSETRHTSPLHHTNDDMMEWIASFSGADTTILFVYVRELGCTRVRRDRSAWETMEAKLKRTRDEMASISAEASGEGGHMFSSVE